MTAAKTPAAVEAQGSAPITFDFRGLAITVPASMDWPFEVIEAFEDGKVSAILRGLLGPEQYAAFKATKPTVRDAAALIEALQSAAGIAGN
jgi:hypothetical protein